MQDSDVQLETMPIEGETVAAYIARLRELHRAKANARLDALTAVVEARGVLARLRRAGAPMAQVRRALDSILALSRAAGRARYEFECVEFALSEAFHAVNR